jgi:hypothetical protein
MKNNDHNQWNRIHFRMTEIMPPIVRVNVAAMRPIAVRIRARGGSSAANTLM